MLQPHQPLNSSQSELILPEQIIEADTSLFAEKFNRSPFMFSHNLGNHPLFEIPRMVELADTLLSTGGQVFCRSNTEYVNQKGKDIVEKDQILERLAHIEESDSWFYILKAHTVPEYRALVEKIIPELEELTGLPLSKEITCLDAHIFVASPHAITPYHFDHDITFLFQINGNREADIFPYEPATVSDEELERYYFGDASAGNYSEQKQHKAHVYHLVPGKGVHHPVRAPHYFKNGNSYSVALGIHWFMRSYDLQAPIYQANFILRQLGLKPKPPGQSALSDKLKIWAIGLISKRNPKTKDEVIHSGGRRITNLVKIVTKILHWLKLK